MSIQTVSPTEFIKQYQKLKKNLAQSPVVITEKGQPDTLVVKLKGLDKTIKKIKDQIEKIRIKKLHDTFVKRVLEAEKEPADPRYTTETDEDIDRFYENLKQELIAKGKWKARKS